MAQNNGTKLCKYCKTEIPADAKICPNCKKNQSGKMKWIIIAVVAIIVIAALASGDDSDSPSDNNPKKVGESTKKENVQVETSQAETQQQEQEVDNKFNVGDVVETSDLRISFLSAGEWKSDNEFIQPKDGYMYYRMEFEFENIGNSDHTISSLTDWDCYADGYSMDQSWFGDDQIGGTISPGKKAKGAVYYEVPVDTKEIELTYKINYFTQNKIIFIAK